MDKSFLTKILLTGEGGQGVQTVAKIISDAAYQSNYEICFMPHYGVEMRMGISLAYLQISHEKISYPKFNHADFLLILAARDLEQIQNFISPKTKVINCLNIQDYLKENKLSSKVINMLALGIMVKELNEIDINLPDKIIQQIITKELGSKPGLEQNLQAYELGKRISKEKYLINLSTKIDRSQNTIYNFDQKKNYWQFPSLCKSCGICLEHCPTKALTWSNDKLSYISRPMPEVNLEKCIACGICASHCPDCAIKVEKK